jgi:hypothetical protein
VHVTRIAALAKPACASFSIGVIEENTLARHAATSAFFEPQR